MLSTKAVCLREREREREREMSRGQEEIPKLMVGFADSMALKCAVQLRIADIMNSQARPLTLDEIGKHLPSSSPNLQCLARIMRLLARRGIFGAQKQGPNTLYSLTPASKCLVRDNEQSRAPLVLFVTDPIAMAPWHYFSDCVLQGGAAFEKAHGCGLFEFTKRDPEFNKVFNEGLAGGTKMLVDVVLKSYGDGFKGLASLVDVGGGIGVAINSIINSYPNIKGINFDLPHVVAMAPPYDGVEHVGGDMFLHIPSADAVFIKGILHDWGDDDCVKILKNCRKAIPESTGKVIIVDMIMQQEEEEDDPSIDFKLFLDLMMVAHTSGGKERTEGEWKKVLEEAGFPRFNIIPVPSFSSLIVAFPS